MDQGRTRVISTVLAAGLLGLCTLAQAGEKQGPVASTAIRSDSVVHVTTNGDKRQGDHEEIKVALAIDPGWHVYANSVGKDFPGVPTTVKIEAKPEPADVLIDYPEGTLVRDAFVGDHYVYENATSIKLIVRWPDKANHHPFDVLVRLQACSKQKCLLPANVKVRVP
jgi:DsbC/DsbD-like thiol-disulfide interchange protein